MSATTSPSAAGQYTQASGKRYSTVDPRLRLAVRAIDAHGHRQLVLRAGVLRVAGS